MNIPLSSDLKAKIGFTEHAVIQGGFNREYMVLSDRGAYRAQLAFSCFVQPETGDKVLINVDGKQSHIIAVIERPDNQDAKLSFPASLKVETKQGDLTFSSHRDIKLTATRQHSIVSEDLNITANSTQVYSTEMQVSGKNLKAQWTSIQTLSELITSVADKLIKTVKNSFSNVEGVEQKNSKNYVQNVSSTTTIRSQHAVITAEKDMKIDGERIHMG
ncbi:DUF3540 domain-containing protein [Psychrosphaera sp. 1_MG-2023]|uniref:DUF3540 domain-containing protein n=1 Tax=Psychrosphaera sp. 1_MG-2023 TaxID=3062643 RepID=UPI0026E284C2|nr:DUF3540 domain-containing protein [Psychrosphaera sp. 1_MG-2023]MDO6721408.1 DUF3540 domain-containing protein [Psychrosphaera sp. 1_MG-2023]